MLGLVSMTFIGSFLSAEKIFTCSGISLVQCSGKGSTKKDEDTTVFLRSTLADALGPSLSAVYLSMPVLDAQAALIMFTRTSITAQRLAKPWQESNLASHLEAKSRENCKRERRYNDM